MVNDADDWRPGSFVLCASRLYSSSFDLVEFASVR